MKLLIDFDGLLYSAVYRIVSFSEIRRAIREFGKEGARQWILEEVYNEGLNRCENQLLQIQNHISEQMINEITGVELFITTCSNSFRKELSPSYKANRKRNKYVWMLRDHYQINGAHFSDTHEADDLIAIRAKEIGVDNCIVVSPDKDLKQIGGYYWSYYRQKSRDMDGELIINEFGFAETEFKQKAIDYISMEDASKMFWVQMLMGDNSDGVKGLNKVGVKTAEKILFDSSVHWFRTAREYISRGQKQDFKTNYKLLKLG